MEKFQDLEVLVEMADYYCALPAISNSLSGSLSTSPKFMMEVHYNSREVLRLATTLRHAGLFK